jgi:MFS family permease
LIKLSGPYVGRVKKPSVKWWGRVKLYSMAMMMMPAAGPALLMAYLVSGNPPVVAGPQWVFIVAFFIALFAWVIFCRWWYHEDDNPMWRMLVRHYRNVVAGEIALRSDVLVSPDDPRAIYINEIPRRFWGNLGEAKKDSESGFLLIDADQDQFLFEGDRFRYIIPVASILRCEVEEVTKTQSTAGFYAVVLIARTKTGTHDFPFLPISGIEGENRHEKAYSLQNLIWTEFGAAIQQNSMDHNESSSTNPNETSSLS